MFGILDEIFDFNNDGELDALEQGAEFGFLDELTKDEVKEKLSECVDVDDFKEELEEAGLDPDDYDLDDFEID